MVNQASYVLVEVLSIVGGILNQTARIFIERIIVTPVFSAVATLAKSFTEIITVTGSRIYQTSRIFVETIVIGVVYEGVLSVIKLFTETIKIAGTRITEVALTFIENILALQVFSYLRQRNFTEIIKAVGSFAHYSAKELSETIAVSWEKLTSRSFSYIESIFVSGALSPHAIGKLLTENFIVSGVLVFGKTQFVILIDGIMIGTSFLKATARIFVENVVMASDVVIRYMGRLFEERVIINGKGFQDEIHLLYGRVLYETVAVIGALAEWVIGKLIPETIKIAYVFYKASAWLMTETIIVAGTIITQIGRIFIETVKVISNKIIDIGRVLTEFVIVADTIGFRRTQYKILTDVIKATSTLLNSTGRVLNEVLTVADAMGSWVIGKLFIQPIKIIQDFTAVWQLGRIFSEIIKVADNVFTQGIKILTETIVVAGSFVLGTISKLLLEVVKVAEYVNKSLPARVFTEIIAITDNLFNQSVKILTETVAVVGEFTLGTISKLIKETIKVVDNFTKEWTLSRVFTEVVEISGDLLNETGLILKETVVAVGTFVLGTISKLFLETIIIGENFAVAMTRVFTEIVVISGKATNRAGQIFTEIISVVGTMASPLIVKVLNETIEIGTSFVRTVSRIFTEVVIVIGEIYQIGTSFIFYETIKAVDTLTHVVGKLIVNIIAIGRDKTKFVLNGIQVGLWKKIARVTNGVWRKISRNDN